MDRSFFHRHDLSDRSSSVRNWEVQGSDSAVLMDLLCTELQCALAAERWVLDRLPAVVMSASSEGIKQIVSTQTEHTLERISRSQLVFDILQKCTEDGSCESIMKITEELDAVIAATPPGTPERDVALLLATQKVTHYGIATYSGLAALANALRVDDVAELLEISLAEVQETDGLLKGLAMQSFNATAVLV